MKDIRPIVSRNLANLRRKSGYTQSELAERFQYSDKAISRWENGDTLPDINVLYDLCVFYGVSMSDLVDENYEVRAKEEGKEKSRNSLTYRILLSITSGAFVWFFATLTFFYLILTRDTVAWTLFVWAVPISLWAVLLSERKWFNSVAKLVLHTVAMWSLLAAMFLQTLQYNFWPIFLIGIPLQVIIVLIHKLKEFK